MALSDRSKALLYEIYEVSTMQFTVVAGGGGTSKLQPDIYSSGKSIKDQLEDAFVKIGENEEHQARVEEILKEWEELSVDPSIIDSDGYSLRPNKNIKAIRLRLYTYTGIVFKTGCGGNRIGLG